MKIGIISDTHSRVDLAQDALTKLLADGAEFIIHAGDLVSLEMLNMLKSSTLNYIAVYGNNDAHLTQYHNEFNLVQEPSYFQLADLKFKLMHMPFHMSPDADIVIFGHTHIFKTEYIQQTLFLNPGEVCAREKPISEFVMLEVLKTEFIVNHYNIATNSSTCRIKEYRYER